MDWWQGKAKYQSDPGNDCYALMPSSFAERLQRPRNDLHALLVQWMVMLVMVESNPEQRQLSIKLYYYHWCGNSQMTILRASFANLILFGATNKGARANTSSHPIPGSDTIEERCRLSSSPTRTSTRIYLWPCQLVTFSGAEGNLTNWILGYTVNVYFHESI